MALGQENGGILMFGLFGYKSVGSGTVAVGACMVVISRRGGAVLVLSSGTRAVGD